MLHFNGEIMTATEITSSLAVQLYAKYR